MEKKLTLYRVVEPGRDEELSRWFESEAAAWDYLTQNVTTLSEKLGLKEQRITEGYRLKEYSLESRGFTTFNDQARLILNTKSKQ